MKTLKFRPYLVGLILNGSKTSTWRLFDDKNLQVGDQVELLNWETGEKFAEAEIESVREDTLQSLWPDGFKGHEKFDSYDQMLETYRKYYGDKVQGNTTVKIINFQLL